MGKKDKEFYRSAIENMMTESFYYEWLKEISLSMFEWKNLPSTIDVRALEETLFDRGFALFFEDEVMGFLGLPGNNSGNLDVYGYPINRRAYGINGYNKELSNKDSVLILNNYTMTPCAPKITNFSLKLYNIDRTINTNVNAQKTPIAIKCNEKQKLSMINLYQQYEGNVPLICTYDDLNFDGFTVLKTDAPYVADKLMETKTQIFNEALTYLGIPNTSYMKKERMISDEVIRNQGGTLASKYGRLQMRQDACRKINEMFGLNIWCEFRTEGDAINE